MDNSYFWVFDQSCINIEKLLIVEYNNQMKLNRGGKRIDAGHYSLQEAYSMILELNFDKISNGDLALSTYIEQQKRVEFTPR